MKYFRVHPIHADFAIFDEMWNRASPRLDDRLFTEGALYNGPTPIELKRECGRVARVNISTCGALIVVREIAERIVQLEPNEVQRIPAQTRGTDGLEIVNVIEPLDAVDECSRLPYTLILSRRRIGERKIFRLKRMLHAIFVAEDVAAALHSVDPLLHAITFEPITIAP